MLDGKGGNGVCVLRRCQKKYGPQVVDDNLPCFKIHKELVPTLRKSFIGKDVE